MVASYSPSLVALSVAIAIMASYVALDLARQVATTRGRSRVGWLVGGAFAMGTGIWSMHYIGMLAFQLPVQVQYDWPTVALSLAAAILASAVAMFVASRPTMGMWRALSGSVFMGVGIAGMHYIGMAAMRLPATPIYDPMLVMLSVVLAMAISFVALRLTFRLRGSGRRDDWRKVGSATVMGAAIPVMHYTGMAAVHFTPAAMIPSHAAHAVSVSSLGLTGIIGVTFMVLGLAVLTSLMDRRMSARVRDDMERREFILKAAALGLWEQDLVTGNVEWSDTMQIVHGVPSQSASPSLQAFLEHVHPGDRPRLRRTFDDAVASGAGYTVEYRSLRPDGTERWIESTASVTRDTAERPTRIVGVDRDITGRKNSEAALVESERAYRSTFEGAPTGVAHLSLAGRWIRVNRRLCEILGYTAQELLLLDISTLMHPENIREQEEALKALMAGTRERYQGEGRMRRGDGSDVWTSVTVTVHRDESGSPRYLISVIDDITERKTLEHALTQSQKMDAIGQLAGGVAHDFNNLLTAILGFAQLVLTDEGVEEKIRRDVKAIEKAAQTASSLTRQLLAFSRRQALEPRILDLNTVVSGMEKILRRLVGERVSLETSLAADLDRVSADRSQIEQVVMNLVVNARDAMPHGGTLSISTDNVMLDAPFRITHPGAKEGPHVRIRVRDTGTGIDQSVRPRLFEPFFTTKQRGQGTGLGLATVYGVVKQSNGYIDLESVVGAGSTFDIYLPQASAPLQERTAPSAELPRGSETILLVEDQPDVRRIASEALTRHGYRVLEAGDGEEALARIEQHPGRIELLLTDVVMPGLGGRELARLVTVHRQDIRTMFMSGYTDAILGKDGTVDPGLVLLQKPFSPATLLGKVREVLDGSFSPAI